MKAPSDRRYSQTHEWFLLDGDVVTMGITQFAADELTDITYVELPEIGKTVAAGDAIGEIESVKATSDVQTAVSGSIIEVNTTLPDQPERINEDAFGDGWLVKIKVAETASFRALMDAKEYKSFVRAAR